MFKNPLSINQWRIVISDMEVGDRVTMGSVTLERDLSGFVLSVQSQPNDGTRCSTPAQVLDAINVLTLADSAR